MNFVKKWDSLQSVMYLSKLTIKIMHFLMCFPSGIPAVESVSHKVLSEKFQHNENQREKEREKKKCVSSSGYKCWQWHLIFQFKLSCHHLGCLFHKLPHVMSPSLSAVTEKLVSHLKLPSSSPLLPFQHDNYHILHHIHPLLCSSLTFFSLPSGQFLWVLCSIFISLLNN